MVDETVAEFVASNRPAQGPGTLYTAGGFQYEELDPSTTDIETHITNAAGVKFKLLPTPAGHYNFMGMNPAADGTTDDYPLLEKLLALPTVPLTGLYRSGPSIYFPIGGYFMGQTIELKTIVHLWGDYSGLPSGPAPVLKFPANTAGIVVNRYNTLNGAIEETPTGGADGSRIEGLILRGSGGTDRDAHGVWLRARAVGRRLGIDDFAGNGWCPKAASNGGDSLQGNCNNWILDTARITECEHGVY